MRVLVTAGTVYGRLDDNKLVSNRVRGIWALRFAGYLSTKGHCVILLLPDTMPRFVDLNEMIGTDWSWRGPLCREGHGGGPGAIEIIRHSGFDDYHEKCLALAPEQDTAIMAAAVVNWIPADPVPGKMPTEMYEVGDIINVPFVLAPRVIEEMKAANPQLTLIGCKMLIGSTDDELVEAAYGVLLKSRCNAVIANDMGRGLRRKLIVGKDRSIHEYDNDWGGFYEALAGYIEDEHFHTERFKLTDPTPGLVHTQQEFGRLVEKHRRRFMPVEGGRVFGAVAVKATEGWLVSPREKGEAFASSDATLVSSLDWDRLVIRVPEGWNKASLNAPLLIRYGALYGLDAVVHFHEQVEGLPTLPYYPPGTERDNNRELAACVLKDGFNIEGHGCVIPAG